MTEPRCSSQKLLNIQSSGVPVFNRTTTTTSTEHRLKHPRVEPLFMLNPPSRNPNPINHKQDTQRPFSQRSRITLRCWNVNKANPSSSSTMVKSLARPSNHGTGSSFNSLHPSRLPAVALLRRTTSAKRSPSTRGRGTSSKTGDQPPTSAEKASRSATPRPDRQKKGNHASQNTSSQVDQPTHPTYPE